MLKLLKNTAVTIGVLICGFVAWAALATLLYEAPLPTALCVIALAFISVESLRSKQ